MQPQSCGRHASAEAFSIHPVTICSSASVKEHAHVLSQRASMTADKACTACSAGLAREQARAFGFVKGRAHVLSECLSLTNHSAWMAGRICG